MTDYVLTGLVKRRAELAGEIEETHNRLRKMIEDLEKHDSVILQFDPSHQVEAIRPKAFPPPPDWSHRGEMTKASDDTRAPAQASFASAPEQTPPDRTRGN